MKLRESIEKWNAPHPFFTLEFFPPRTDQGFDNLLRRIARLASLDPLAVSITWGAGGSTKDRSLELAGLVQSEHALDTVLHLTCTNMEKGTVEGVLRDAKARGIRNILALRGDPPRGSEYWIPTDPRFTHAVDLVRFIRSEPEFADYFCVGVAAYPDGHSDAASREEELQHLKEKVDAGAEFIVTQLFYDVDRFIEWQKEVRKIGISIPIIPGIAPIQSYASFVRMTKLCGTSIPDAVQEAIEPIRNDDQKIKEYGVQLATAIVRRVTSEAGCPGVHFCTLNLEKSVRTVLEGLEWSAHVETPHNRIIQDDSDVPVHTTHLPPSVMITASEASHMVERPSTPISTKDRQLPDNNSLGTGTWDDFPNGRFGDPSSPAYGTLDPWNTNLDALPPDGLTQWGHPTSISDIRTLFLTYLSKSSTSSTTPFSPESLSPETESILPYLVKLTQRDFWTIASQPVVDAAPSTDSVFGWGPRGGYVFQKAFVECFVDREGLEWLKRRIEERGKGWVTFYAGNAEGEVMTSTQEETRNAVTWGVFPGQEIAQPTVIERESFLLWKDEAFGTWAQWALLYAPNSPQRALLEEVRVSRWLVSIVHHDFKDADALWNLLCDDA